MFQETEITFKTNKNGFFDKSVIDKLNQKVQELEERIKKTDCNHINQIQQMKEKL